MSKITDIYKKYREPLLYIIVGGMTTVINFAVYLICTRSLEISPIISNAISWCCAVTFSYIADKIFVFQSKDYSITKIIAEAMFFIGARLASGFMDMGLFYLLNVVMGINDIIVKVFVNVLVVVVNYLFSKFVIFRKKETA